MLEILLLIRMGKAIARNAREKGRSAGGAIVLLLFFWFGGEFMGGLTAGAVTAGSSGEPNMLLVYALALASAAAGAFLAFRVVASWTSYVMEPVTQTIPLASPAEANRA